MILQIASLATALRTLAQLREQNYVQQKKSAELRKAKLK